MKGKFLKTLAFCLGAEKDVILAGIKEVEAARPGSVVCREVL